MSSSRCLPLLIAVLVVHQSLAQPGVASAQELKVHEFREVHLGMEFRLMVGGSDSAATAVARAAFDLVDSLDLVFSDWRAESELRRLEEAPVGWWIPVSPAMADVLDHALFLARGTGGRFDPTIGPLTRLWRDSRTAGTDPPAAVHTEASARVGWQNLHLDLARSRVRMAAAGMQFDLGAVAKGWILDRVAELIVARGIDAALVEAGGDLVLLDPPPGRGGWRVALGTEIAHLSNTAVSTSGSSVQWRLDDSGVLRSHVIDPVGGAGRGSGWEVTVLAPSAVISDGIATSLTLLPEAEWDRLLSHPRMAGVRIVSRPATDG